MSKLMHTEKLADGSILKVVGGKPRICYQSGVTRYMSLCFKTHYSRGSGFVKVLERSDREVIAMSRAWAASRIGDQS